MRVKNLKFAYNIGKNNEQQVFSDLNDEFVKGRYHVILGKSGSGKSTLLHIMGGILKPDSGVVDYDGTDLYALKPKELSAFINRNIAFVFQSYYLDDNFTIYDNIAMPLMIRKDNYKDIIKRADELLEKVGLEGIGKKRPSELSGGECQRVCIARALITEPKYILADEPTGNLDSDNARNIIELLHSVQSNDRAVITVTHDKDAVRDSDIVHIIENGSIKNA